MNWVTTVIAWYNAHMSYGAIVALMAIESSFIPFPSEVVIPPAAFVAENPDSALYVSELYWVNLLLIVLAGTLGAIIGACINYALAWWLGRPIMYAFADSKWGHMCLLDGKKLAQAEEYFNAHGKVSTFVGRLIPAIRQLISVPAGLSKMHFGTFIAYTTLGAAIWNTALALLGYIAKGQEALIKEYSHELSVAILGLVAVAIIYVVAKKVIGTIRRS